MDSVIINRAEVRAKLLAMTKPASSNPDLDLWLAAAAKLEAYVFGSGHADKAPADTKAAKASPKARIPAE